ncbi:hypothetical protein [Nocardiopsis sp. CC223A]|uniref:hypothetical protein n=1 Tax=Nocardiopsis sp. CC223A TaxID=3044051 RepID=UPI00278C04E4|nr:hypothetical protein [Nocardiopsis sp. CC223A]
MNEDQASNSIREPLIGHPDFRLWFTAACGALACLIGVVTLLVILTLPSVRFPDADNPVECFPVWNVFSATEGYDLQYDRVGSHTGDLCNRQRVTQTGKAVLVAVPTAIAGSVTANAFLFRGRLSRSREQMVETGEGKA